MGCYPPTHPPTQGRVHIRGCGPISRRTTQLPHQDGLLCVPVRNKALRRVRIALRWSGPDWKQADTQWKPLTHTCAPPVVASAAAAAPPPCQPSPAPCARHRRSHQAAARASPSAAQHATHAPAPAPCSRPRCQSCPACASVGSGALIGGQHVGGRGEVGGCCAVGTAHREGVEQVGEGGSVSCSVGWLGVPAVAVRDSFPAVGVAAAVAAVDTSAMVVWGRVLGCAGLKGRPGSWPLAMQLQPGVGARSLPRQWQGGRQGGGACSDLGLQGLGGPSWDRRGGWWASGLRWNAKSVWTSVWTSGGGGVLPWG